VTSTGIETATFRLEAQCLKQLRHLLAKRGCLEATALRIQNKIQSHEYEIPQTMKKTESQ
jgi:hypothetical protein